MIRITSSKRFPLVGAFTNCASTCSSRRPSSSVVATRVVRSSIGQYDPTRMRRLRDSSSISGDCRSICSMSDTALPVILSLWKRNRGPMTICTAPASTSTTKRYNRYKTTNNNKPSQQQQTKTNPHQHKKRPPPSTTLPPPPILFSSNHLLLINKPPGYHSQPNSSPTIHPITRSPIRTDPKCLLTRLQVDGMGGGSRGDFLLPMHRLDQPCSGVILLAKTGKAGTRVGNAFRGGRVEKEYYCVVEGDLEGMIHRSECYEGKDDDDDVEGNKGNDEKRVYTLSGIVKPVKKGGPSPRGNNAKGKGKSVRFLRLSSNTNNNNGRICHLQWHLLKTTNPPNHENPVHLLSVKTKTGAKHQVRAMLAQIAAAPICGDLRYGAETALKDKSVALHARSLCLPTVKLGDVDMTKEVFVAPIPKTWRKYFLLREKDL